MWFLAVIFVSACGLDVVGTAIRDDAGDSLRRNATPNLLDGAAIGDSSAPNGRDGSHEIDALADARTPDAQGDVDAFCKSKGSICSSASECCGLRCEDDEDTLRCQ